MKFEYIVSFENGAGLISTIWISVFVSTLCNDLDSCFQVSKKSDLLFNGSTRILGSVVTCSNVSDGDYKFAEETWSCYDIRVNNSRIRSYFWRDADTAIDGHCTDDSQGSNDHTAICLQLLVAHNISKLLTTTILVRSLILSALLRLTPE